ncbi:2-isopropylmalate synthase [Desulfosarcina sp. BuS5]|uniref:hypothetical protein n=1 Tax=Desulfosarcina sp. BuS5 TaxID=933262 RepID=UPI00047F1328|nr:hypothetical protein [Desulfosarcina sp. BuS5]WDN90145.1 2-isopropylmalate synthase [Desulfosarcina sp. BuS5]
MRKIIVFDQTIREGMQYRGLMFSYAERLKIMEFQQALGVDISQAGYPPAHESEIRHIKKIYHEASRRNYNIRISGLCRALVKDASRMVETGLEEFNLHTSFTAEMLSRQSVESIFNSLKDTVLFIRSKVEKPSIEVSLLDIGKTDMELLKKCAVFLINNLKINILSLPDTSGLMSPNQVCKRVKIISSLAGKNTQIGIHCHNDLGMATANTIMGILAGASIIEVSALGIGERNGIGDIFITGKNLKDQGFDLNLETEKEDIFREYYEFVDSVCYQKTGIKLLNDNTPFFGNSSMTHVAGTHGIGQFGLAADQEFYLNVLCGKHLVENYLKLHKIGYEKKYLQEIVARIKDKSAEADRCVTKEEVKEIVVESG